MVKTENLIVARRETGLEVNVDITRYMVISRDQNTGRRHNRKVDNNSYERVEQFKYLRKTLTYQNSEEIKSILKAGNTCYHSVKNLLSSSLLSKNLQIMIY